MNMGMISFVGREAGIESQCFLLMLQFSFIHENTVIKLEVIF